MQPLVILTTFYATSDENVSLAVQFQYNQTNFLHSDIFLISQKHQLSIAYWIWSSHLADVVLPYLLWHQSNGSKGAKWVGVGVFSKVIATFNHVDESFNLQSCSACWARFMYHQELWPTCYSKFSLFRVAFLIFFSITTFSPYFLLVGLLLQCVAPFRSRELV